MNSTTRLYHEAGDVVCHFVTSYLTRLLTLLQSLDPQAVADFIGALEVARDHDRTVFFAGNGGSAATCSHFVNDLTKATRVNGRRGFQAFSLTDNVALLTALANDEGYDAVFTGQMQDLFAAGDVLVAISASGNSPNILAAAKLAKTRGGTIVGLMGFDGGALRDMCDVVVHVNTPKGEYGPVEDIHLVLNHIVTSYLSLRLHAEPAGKQAV